MITRSPDSRLPISNILSIFAIVVTATVGCLQLISPAQQSPVATIPSPPKSLPDWNERVFYEVFVRSFYDSDGNGIGDLQGLISKLDYLNDGNPATTTDLGVTGLWLMPIMESPSYHGYDVVDYNKVEPDYGTSDDFKALIKEAHRRDMIVVIDMVLNHTSDENSWFLASQKRDPRYANWYIWRDTDPGYTGPWGEPVWHADNGRYYYGVFTSDMPDLNFLNRDVTTEMEGISRFWLQDMGADGFRLDAVRHLIEDGAVQENTDQTHRWLKNYHSFIKSVHPDALLVGEIWTNSLLVAPYVGDEVDLAFEFDLASAFVNSLRGDRSYLEHTQEAALELFPPGQYAAFLTNHDQNRVMSQLLGDANAAKAAATLLLTNPGVPFIYYGEEVGMQGVKPDERIRTPMQWSAEADTAGFTTRIAWELPDASYSDWNVEAQTADPNSLLSHYRALIQLRTDHPALTQGAMLFVQSDNKAVYSYLRYSTDETLLIIINLSGNPVTDYHLSLAAGPLVSAPKSIALLGQSPLAAPALNSTGGFQAYIPLPELAPHSSLIIKLSP